MNVYRPLLIMIATLLALGEVVVWAHDPLEISSTVYLHTNRVEVTVVMLRRTIMRIADRQGIHLLDFSIPAERDEAMPVLRTQGTGLFAINCGTNSLRTAPAKVTLGVEDHVSFKLSYALPEVRETNATLRFDARLLGRLPAEEGYGVTVVVLDMANNKVIEQKLLNSPNAAFEITLPTLPAPTNTPPVEVKPPPVE